MDYTGLTLDQLDDLISEYIHRHRNNGGTHESDTSINDLTREKIRKYSKKHENCWLGKINLYDEEKESLQVQLVKYEGQEIKAFEYGFIIPCYDTMLIKILRDYNSMEKYNEERAISFINVIEARIYTLNGCYLLWV